MKLRRAVLVFFAAGQAFGGSLDDCLFTVRSDHRECGSAFLMKQDDASWMVSNCHVVRGFGTIEYVGMTDSSRVFALPETIEVATNRDAVRFLAGGGGGFTLTDQYEFDDPVFAFGNSAGAGVVTKSKGKIVGKGRGEIEVTCEIIPGNSGGPVVNAKNEVIGISTYIIMAPGKQYSSSSANLLRILQTRKGTRYEDDTRRFAVSLHDAKWQSVSRDVFKAEAALAQVFDDQFGQYGVIMASVFYNRPVNEEKADVFPGSWLRSYNNKLADMGYYYSDGDSYVLRAGRQDSFRRTLKKWIADLDKKAKELASDCEKQAQMFVVVYFRNQLLEQAEELHSIRKELAKASIDIDK